ncbi:MAG: transporter substrate-binding domain-containing protein [Campylobacteraceae bacterium]|nr:transporter substrate-binding domain-containing protein [Campylobacteraceae bacterium]
MKLLKIIFTIVSIFIISSSIQANDKGDLVLRVTEIPPMYFQNNKGEWTGRDYSIAKEIIENAGYSVRIVTMPWKRALEALSRGKAVDVLAGVTPNEERAKDYLFIGPYDYEEIGLIVKKEDENLAIHTVSDLIEHIEKTKKKVGYHRGYIFTGEFKKYATNKRYAHDYTNSEQGGYMLRANRIVGFIAQTAVSQYQIDSGVEHMRGLAVHSFIFRRAPNYLAVSKKIDPQVYVDLVSSFNELIWTDIFEKIKKTTWKK